MKRLLSRSSSFEYNMAFDNARRISSDNKEEVTQTPLSDYPYCFCYLDPLHWFAEKIRGQVGGERCGPVVLVIRSTPHATSEPRGRPKVGATAKTSAP